MLDYPFNLIIYYLFYLDKNIIKKNGVVLKMEGLSNNFQFKKNWNYRIRQPFRGIDLLTETVKWQNFQLLINISNSYQLTPSQRADLLHHFWNSKFFVPQIKD